jgi:hypothetical protein
MDEGVMFDDSGFQKMTDPKPGEWLFHFHEPGQSFDEYVASRPIRTAGKRQVLVFQPVGPFSPVEQDIINALCRDLVRSIHPDRTGGCPSKKGVASHGASALEGRASKTVPDRLFSEPIFAQAASQGR